MKKFPHTAFFSALLAAGAFHTPLGAQLVIEDTLTGASSSYDWKAINGACLTAGDNTGTVPACVGLPYYANTVHVGGVTGRLPDPVGKGALRLTNGDTRLGGSNGDAQTGAVISNFTFPTDEGVQVSFRTVTYGGDGSAWDGKYTVRSDGVGADGVVFFLMDGAEPPNVGSPGAALGYSCINYASYGVADGVRGAYVGIGIDEWGNFSNTGHITNTGPGFVPGQVLVRGGGNVTWDWLSRNYPRYYPSTFAQKVQAVAGTCRTGTLWNRSGAAVIDANGVKIPNNSPTTETIPNYNYLGGGGLPGAVKMTNQQGINMPKRGDAIPITYSLRIAKDGRTNMSYRVNGGTPLTVLSDFDIKASNGSMPPSFRFGFVSSTGGGSNVHEITCFKAGPADIASTSAGTNVQQTAQVRAGTQVYLALTHPSNWWGQLTAQDLVYDASSDLVTINPVANWDASCTLTGGACTATGKSASAQGPDERSLFTWDGAKGIPLRWSDLSASQKTALTAGDAVETDDRLSYLQGDRGKEVSRGGSFRNRTGVLGDILGSNPSWVGPPASPYTDAWTDRLYPSAKAPEGTSYNSFKASNATRQNVVYVGANDGYLHGFRAGAYSASGDFVSNASKPNDGREVLAYMPAAALSSIHSTSIALDYANPRYSHNFYVDAPPGTGDLYHSGAWHTWLVGGLGAGGNSSGPINDNTSVQRGAIYALDITDPGKFAEKNAGDLVVGEWNSSTLKCVQDETCGRHLGGVYGTPAIRRLHNGNWAVLFGNGLNSESGTAGLFIMIVDSATGARTFRFIDTGVAGSGGTKNGMVSVSPADLDGDHITDYVYAGDLTGRVWRFDLTSADASEWNVWKTPLFTAPSNQPITAKVAIASIPALAPGEKPRVMVAFGTGRQLPQTMASDTTYAAGAHSIYGVWDWNMGNWNAKVSKGAQFQEGKAPTAGTLGANDLQAQTITELAAGTASGVPYRSVSKATLCWQGSSACGSDNNKFGWKVALPVSGEQVIYSPATAYGMFLVNTTIPGAGTFATCDAKPTAGYTMAVTMGGGAAPEASFFADPSGGFAFSGYGGAIVSGIGLGGTGTPSLVTAGSGTSKGRYIVQQTSEGKGAVTKINPGAAGSGGRINWLKLR